jgi:hypothetical protein
MTSKRISSGSGSAWSGKYGWRHSHPSMPAVVFPIRLPVAGKIGWGIRSKGDDSIALGGKFPHGWMA